MLGVYLHILANAGGVVLSYLEWVQDLPFFFWKEKEVNSRLRDILVAAFQRSMRVAEEKGMEGL